MQLLCSFLLVLAVAKAQLIFGSNDEDETTSETTVPVAEIRLGLLGSALGLSLTGDISDTTSGTTVRPSKPADQTSEFTNKPADQTSEFTNKPADQTSEFTNPTGRVPEDDFDEVGGSDDDQCCCVDQNQECGDYWTGAQDLIGQGIINARQVKKPEIVTRIVNIDYTDTQTTSSPLVCRAGNKTCCYHSSVDLSSLGHTCSAQQAAPIPWIQSCNESIERSNGHQCGVRSFTTKEGLKHGESSPGEFPFTCLLLNQDSEFIGTCALIPSGSHNNNSRGNVKIITAAHKLKLKEHDQLIVRVGEYDASGFNPPETVKHQEYTVSRFLMHPEFNTRRLSNDIAILYTQKPIQLSNNVNTACLPSCRDQFNHTFDNGTGIRCWVAGWGKDQVNGEFQFIQHKVDLPLVDDDNCTAKLKDALNKQKRGQGNRFSLKSSEICAGGELGKDACTGDGGSPLVCQAMSGRWTVVGLVTWGVGCASHVPGVYARVSEFQSWIDAN
jgi:hypothetical protein